MLPRPSSAITLKSADGARDLRFYPSDLKALASLLWAKGTASWRFVGGRCTQANPAQDENGRVIDPDCFDTNPASWHLAVTQQIGVARRAFIIDATYDYEVWNQPVLGYRYRYFNPQTGKSVPDKLVDAVIKRSRYTRGSFRAKYRDASTDSIAGIVMDLTLRLRKRTLARHRRLAFAGQSRHRSLFLRPRARQLGRGDWGRVAHQQAS